MAVPETYLEMLVDCADRAEKSIQVLDEFIADESRPLEDRLKLADVQLTIKLQQHLVRTESEYRMIVEDVLDKKKKQ